MSQATNSMGFSRSSSPPPSPPLHKCLQAPSLTNHIKSHRLSLTKQLNSHRSIKKYKQIIAGLFVLLIAFFFVIVALLINTFTGREEENSKSQEENSYSKARARVFQSKLSDSICQKKMHFVNFSLSDVGKTLYLSPYIERGDLATARDLAQVHNVLGDVDSYSGYITVDSNRSSNLFFWLIPSSVEAATAPLILWLQGGPGWPSMYGLFKENGPYFIELVDQGFGPPSAKLHRNPYSWHTFANMLYIDNPVGTGFSFTHKESGYPTTDLEVADQLLEAIVQIMKLYPVLIPGAISKNISFFAFGESYGGPYSISLAYKILEQIPSRPELLNLINLRGIGLGNALINPKLQFKYSDYINSIGYLSHKQMEKMRQFEKNIVGFIDSNQSKKGMLEFMRMFYEFREELNQSQPYSHGFTNPNVYDITADSDYILGNEYSCLFQDPSVLKAIHVGQQTCKKGQSSYEHLEGVVLTNKAWMLEQVLDHIEVLIYNGNMDIMVNIIGMNNVVNNLTWSGRREFQEARSRPYWVDGKLAGYYAEGGNLTYLVVRNSGHMVPISQPKVTQTVVKDFVFTSL